MAMVAAISTGLFYESASKLSPLTPSCPTGNCTWDNYTTLGICAETADISNLLTSTETSVGYNRSLPNGIYVFAPAGSSTSTFVANANSTNPSIVFGNISLPIADFFVINDAYHPKANATSYALEVAIFFCIQSLHTETRSGQSSTNLTHWDDRFQRTSDPDYFNYTSTPSEQDETFLVTQAGAGYIQGFLATEFQGSYRKGADGGGGAYDSNAIRAFVNATSTPPYDQLAIEQVVGNLATSMSNA